MITAEPFISRVHQPPPPRTPVVVNRVAATGWKPHVHVAGRALVSTQSLHNPANQKGISAEVVVPKNLPVVFCEYCASTMTTEAVSEDRWACHCESCGVSGPRMPGPLRAISAMLDLFVGRAAK